MPRFARVVIPGCPHHLTQRGNNRQDVFFVDDDRRMYLSILKEQAERFGASTDGYCLMSNHVHLIITPREETSLAKVAGRTHFLYTQYVNRMQGRSGHLWQNRFFSCPLGEKHFWAAMRYLERNPVRAKRVRVPWRYEWSSAAAHVSGRDETGLLNLARWEELLNGSDWRETLKEPVDDILRRQVRLRTQTGRPLGSDRFIAKLERTFGRRLRPLPVGRPRKDRKKG